MPITLDGTLGITTPTYGGADTAEYIVPVTAFKNRIINGAMQIDQRNAGASVTGNIFVVDRFRTIVNQSGKLTAQQNAGSVTPPTGFTNYLGITSSSAYTSLSGDFFVLNQAIEGFNVSDLAWGTANAQTVTLSFWVRSSLTGTFGGALRNSDGVRSYPFTFVIGSANTWEQKSITIVGDTSGTWLTNNGVGINLFFDLGSGSSNLATPNAWGSSGANGATGCVSVVGTNGATFYITGVQLEKGSTATSFDTRSIGTELALCQRYCQVYGGFANQRFTVGWWLNGSNSYTQLYGPVNFRSPNDISVTVNSVSNFALWSGGSVFTPTSIVLDAVGHNCVTTRNDISSGATGGNAAVLLAANTSARLTISCEL